MPPEFKRLSFFALVKWSKANHPVFTTKLRLFMVGDLAFMPRKYGSESVDKIYGSSLLPVTGNDDTLNSRLFPFAHMDCNPQELDRHIRPLVLIYRKSEWCEGVPIDPG